MVKELKVSFILLAIFSGIVMAWKSFMNFFSGLSVITGSAGAGINFFAILAILVLLLAIMLKNKDVRKRIIDMFILASVLAVMEFIVYLPLEFGISSYDVYNGFMVYQNVITFIGILFFAYIAFRFITEYLGKELGFVEFILGNRKINSVSKEKKSKELENGSLEEKPNNKQNDVQPEIVENETIEQVDVVENTEE